MKKDKNQHKESSSPQREKDTNEEKNIFPGYPAYSSGEDIYSKFKKEEELDPEDTTKTKEPNEIPGKRNEKSFNEDLAGDDLDIPGSELDDEQEKIGSEDEENNYYSLGGDNHDDLEEDQEDRL